MTAIQWDSSFAWAVLRIKQPLKSEKVSLIRTQSHQFMLNGCLKVGIHIVKVEER